MFSFQDCCFALFLNLSALYPRALALLINFRVWDTKFVNVRYKVLCLATTAHDRPICFLYLQVNKNLLTE